MDIFFLEVMTEQFDSGSSGNFNLSAYSIKNICSDGMEHLKTYEGHSARIWSVDCNAKGILASGGENEVRLWNYAPEAGSASFRTLKMDSMGAVWHISLAEKSLVCGHQTGLVSRHNLKSSSPPVSESSSQNSEYEHEALVVSNIDESIDKVLTTTADRFYVGMADGNPLLQIYSKFFI